MSVPQTKDRPASALRAVFAGIGSLLSVKDKWSGKDKVRAKPAAEAPADDAAPVAEAVAPETTAETVAAEPETVAVETIAEPEPVVEAEKAAEPEAVVAETAAAAEASAAPAAAAELPLENYDELTVASLRARLRNLSNEDLVQLKEYEAAHQNRPEVIKMFQNRLIKMTGSMPKLEA
ncbi:MAG TPA: hypothetical protein VN714_15100 [Trebonia sp.]|nr:hypothetical protein [Trebonia sp.]